MQESRCPECGAAGFADAFVVHGNAVRPGLFFAAVWILAGLAAGPLIYLGGGPYGLVILAVVALALTISGVRRGSPLRSSRHAAVWIVHPDGVIVRSGGNTRHFPKSLIKRIDCSDSFLSSVSQLMLVLHAWPGGPVLASMRMIYIAGSKSDRRARWRRAREILGLWTESPAGPPSSVRR